ncbi:hypothetical protein C8Q77DRAFT_1272118, partial [Trametes polyzona]
VTSATSLSTTAGAGPAIARPLNATGRATNNNSFAVEDRHARRPVTCAPRNVTVPAPPGLCACQFVVALVFLYRCR